MDVIYYSRYFDKVYGGWLGKCLGGAAGAPVEGVKSVIEVHDFSEIMNPDLPNDDLDIQLLWLEVLENKGIKVTSKDLADAWLKKCWYPFSEYGYFIKNYRRGIAPPYSGTFNNLFFKEGMGCPIRSEIWAFAFPGNPELAVKYAHMDAVLDHAGNSVWAEEFLAAVESMAFDESNIIQLINKGLKYIPRDCKLYNCISLVMELYKKDNKDYLVTRQEVIRKFGHHDFTNVVQNLGIIIIALLYGEGDLRKTINIALSCGYDADCTCASAASIIGVMIGAESISNELKALVKDNFVVGIDVKRRSTSIRDLAEDTCKLGLDLYIQLQDSSVKHEACLEVNVLYKEEPSIGYFDTKQFSIEIVNKSRQKFQGKLRIKDVPKGWKVNLEDTDIIINAGETRLIDNEITTSEELSYINNTNILRVVLLDEEGKMVESTSFGFAGASVWKAYGPFSDQLIKAPNPNHPPCHGEGSVLPTVECMVNNEVHLNKEYIDETLLDFDRLTPACIINAYEDLIPVDESFGVEGQTAFYLTQDIISPKDREAWAVIGNNDGFKLWVNGEKAMEKDEIRLWTPYNNAEIIKLSKGKNRIVLKLLRRTENLKFAIGIRKYEGEHYHRKEWYVDFISSI